MKNKGFSLIEMLIVLSVIAAIAVFAFVIYPKVDAANKSRIEISNLNTIKAAIEVLYASRNDYSGLDNNVALKAKVFPSSMVSADGSSVNDIFKNSVSVNSTSSSTFTIYYEGVPASECVKIILGVSNSFEEILLSHKYDQSYDSDSDAVVAGGYYITPIKASYKNLDISNLTKICANGGNNNMISFVSY